MVCALTVALLAGLALGAAGQGSGDVRPYLPRPQRVQGIGSCTLPLDGTWDFDPGGIGAAWKPIEVPGEWVMQGFEVPEGKAALYRRAFEVPDSWRGKRAILRFDAVFSIASVSVNGQPVGTHEGGFTAFEFDVTPHLRFGEPNELRVAVTSQSTADILASASQYAVHALGGIGRKVTLFAVPDAHLSRLHVGTSRTAGGWTLRVDAALRNSGGGAADDLSLALRLRDGRRAVGGEVVVPVGGLRPSQEQGVAKELPFPGVRAWNPEDPKLYTLTCEVRRAGRTVETVTQKVGFREVAVDGDRLLVNGMPVRLRGSNRHEIHPLRGRTVPPETQWEDARLFKAANLNFIRTSHYPPAEEFLEACDEIGLFVEVEAPLCWVGHGANAIWQSWKEGDPKLGPLISRQVGETVLRDINHPSVVIWSLANESAWNPNFEAALKVAKTLDPSRPTTFHDQCWGEYNNKRSAADIAVYHYPYTNWDALPDDKGRPVAFGEYCHLNCYNRAELAADPGVRDEWGLALADMWDRAWKSRDKIGAAIWAGIDDVFLLPGGKTVGYGEWGFIDAWRREKPEYWHVKKVYSPVRVLTRELVAGSKSLSVAIENRFDFTDLDQVRIGWAVGTRKGTASVSAAPHAQATWKLDLPSPAREGEVLDLRFTLPDGTLVDEERLPVGKPVVPEPPCQPLAAGELRARVVDGGRGTPHPHPSPLGRGEGPGGGALTPPSGGLEGMLVVEGRAFAVSFDLGTGLLASAKVGRDEVLVGGPGLFLAPVDGCPETQMTLASKPQAPVVDPIGGWSAEKVEWRQTGEGVSVEASGRNDAGALSWSWLIRADGTMGVAYSFTPKEKTDLRQFGVCFDLPRSFDTLSWARRTQWSSYPEGHLGRALGLAKASPSPGGGIPRTRPGNRWELDRTPLGSHDFRATRRDVHWALLARGTGPGLLARGEGAQDVRAFTLPGAVRLLVVDKRSGTSEGFARAHFASMRSELQPGVAVKGRVRLALVRSR